jgi:hypothetical protein
MRNPTTKMNKRSPIHVGEINGEALRFFQPQTDDDQMPWVSADDLRHAMRAPRHLFREADARSNQEFPSMAKGHNPSHQPARERRCQADPR